MNVKLTSSDGYAYLNERDKNREYTVILKKRKPYNKELCRPLTIFLDDGENKEILYQGNDIVEIEGREIKPDYHSYIESIEWEARRNEYFKTHPKQCIGCGCTQDIALHHLTYENLGYERDEELVPVCCECHQIIHNFLNHIRTNEWHILEEKWKAFSKINGEYGQSISQFTELHKDHIEYLFKVIPPIMGVHKATFAKALRDSVNTKIPYQIFSQSIKTKR